MERHDPLPADAHDGDFGGSTIAARARPIVEFVADGVITLPPSTPLRDVAVSLRRDDVSMVAVGVGDVVDGVVSERDLVQAVATGLDLDATTADEIATDSVRWASVTTTVDDAAEEMLTTYVRHLLVRNDDGSPAGVVSMRDLLTAYLV